MYRSLVLYILVDSLTGGPYFLVSVTLGTPTQGRDGEDLVMTEAERHQHIIHETSGVGTQPKHRGSAPKIRRIKK